MKIKICPKCGSTRITIPSAGLDLKMTQRDMCQDCGEIGNFPEIDEDKVKNFSKTYKNRKI
jgi:RNase P subunit RPR2